MAYYRICSTDGANLYPGEVCADCAEKESQPDTTPPGKGAEPKERAGDEDNNNTQGGKVK